MGSADSDGFVFFGATGDLAYKKIFPALYASSRPWCLLGEAPEGDAALFAGRTASRRPGKWWNRSSAM
jgi:glucose-6-phosphate 1-dehydrogenase